MFGFCAEHRQGSSPSVLSRGVLQQSGILVVWSHFRPSNVVLKSIDSTSHTVRDRQLYCIRAALAAWCKFDSSSLASWAREGTHGNHKMAICSRAARSQSLRSTVREGRRKLVFVRWRRLPWAHRRAGRGAVDQKFVKCLSESSNFVKKTPTLFSFEILGNEMRDSQLCKVYSSGGTFCFGTSSRKYRRSKSAPAGVLHAVVWQDAYWWVSIETEKMPIQFSS